MPACLVCAALGGTQAAWWQAFFLVSLVPQICGRRPLLRRWVRALHQPPWHQLGHAQAPAAVWGLRAATRLVGTSR